MLEGVINLSQPRAFPFKGHLCPTGDLGCKIRLLCLMFTWETGVLGFTCVNSSPRSLGAGFVSQINCREHKTTFKPEAALSVPWFCRGVCGCFALLGSREHLSHSPGLRLPRGWQQMGRIPPCSQTLSCFGNPAG